MTWPTNEKITELAADLYEIGLHSVGPDDLDNRQIAERLLVWRAARREPEPGAKAAAETAVMLEACAKWVEAHASAVLATDTSTRSADWAARLVREFAALRPHERERWARMISASLMPSSFAATADDGHCPAVQPEANQLRDRADDLDPRTEATR